MRRLLPTVALLFVSVSALGQAPRQSVLLLKDIHGRPMTLSDYRGRVVLINFWATWCIPCRTEIPEFIKMQRKYRKEGLSVLGITYPPQKKSEVLRFMRKVRINYRVALGTKETKILFTPSDTLPMTVVVDREGVVRTVIEGIMYSEEFDQHVKPLLMTGRSAPEKVPRLSRSRALRLSPFLRKRVSE